MVYSLSVIVGAVLGFLARILYLAAKVSVFLAPMLALCIAMGLAGNKLAGQVGLELTTPLSMLAGGAWTACDVGFYFWMRVERIRWLRWSSPYRW